MKDTFHLDSTSVQPWVSCLLKLQGSDNISSQGGQREWLFFPFLFFHLMSMLCWSLVNCSFVLVLSIQWTDSVMTYTYSFYYFLLILLPTEVIEQGWVKFSVLNISSLWSNYSVQLLSHVKLLWPHGLQHPGFPVHHQLPELAHIHVHWVGDAIQPLHPLSSPSPPAFNLSQHQGLFKWVSSLHQVAKVLELQLQHQSFQWIFRTDFF